MTIAIATLVCLSIPLTLSFQDLSIKNQARMSVNDIIRKSTTFSESHIQTLAVQRDGDTLVVDLNVEALPDSISAEQIDSVRSSLAEEIARPVKLNVSVIPIEQFVSNPPASESRASLEYKSFKYKIAKKIR